jgi:acetyltransferase-like isoleucine patch superfamily enzyme
MPIQSILNLARRAAMGSASRARNVFYRLSGVRMHGYVWLRAVEIPYNHSNIELHRCHIDRGVILLCSGPAKAGIKLSIGQGTYINRNTFLDAIDSLTVGSNVAIGPGCYITDHDHGSEIGRPLLEQEMISQPTHIEDDVWIGANVVVLKGVTIGRGTIVGAGSVVTKSLPPNSIAVGVPAQVIRSRTPVAQA